MEDGGLVRFMHMSSLRKAAALVVLLLVAAGAAGAFWLAWSMKLSIADIEATILSWGRWGMAASIGLMVLHSFVPFPAELISIANGMVYGPYWGVVITWIGAMLGAFLAFGLARILGRPFVEAIVSQKNWQKVDDLAARQGWSVVFLSRFVPIISFNLINYAAGITRISWWTFAWTTGVGILPMTTLMVVMGHHIEHLSWTAWLLVIALGIAMWFLLHRRFQSISEG
jgi:uncharacterized membrane protein YdjX (TVP38/TMEM64 family)